MGTGTRLRSQPKRWKEASWPTTLQRLTAPQTSEKQEEQEKRCGERRWRRKVAVGESCRRLVALSCALPPPSPYFTSFYTSQSQSQRLSATSIRGAYVCLRLCSSLATADTAKVNSWLE